MKAKERYRLQDGSIVPGTTTITRELGWNREVLIAWANKKGLEGIDSRKFLDDKASIGTLAHTLILGDLKKEKVDTSDYTEKQIIQAKTCLKNYYNWCEGKKILPIIVEQPLVHEEFKYGGTPDFFGNINDKFILVDYKTGGGIYSEYTIQVAAYAELIKLQGHQVDEVRILGIPRSEDEVFSEKIITSNQLKIGWEIFKHLLGIYNLKSGIEKG